MNKINLSGLPRCNQIWEDMQPIEGGRLCAQCNKCIVDFREKSDLEIAIIRATSPEPVCGIYTEEQLSFNIHSSKRQKNPFRRALAFSATLLALLPKLQGQNNVEKMLTTNQLMLFEKDYSNDTIPKPISEEKKATNNEPIFFRGRIVAAIDSMPLVGATVLVKGYAIGAMTDIDGSFNLALSSDFNDGKPVVIQFSGIGYEMQEKEYQLDTLNSYSELIALELGEQLSEFVVTGSRHYRLNRWLPWRKEFWRRFGL